MQRNSNMQEVIPNWYFYLSAFCIQWFSIFDIMDGMRARRQKTGTPLGRLIDEGNYIYILLINLHSH
jgi:phosphatidylglycerophosphate synthase